MLTTLSSTTYVIYHCPTICIYVTATTNSPVFATLDMAPYVYPYVWTPRPMPLWVCPHLRTTSTLHLFPAYTPLGSTLSAHNNINFRDNFPVHLFNLPPRVSPLMNPPLFIYNLPLRISQAMHLYKLPVIYRSSHTSYASPYYTWAYNSYSMHPGATNPSGFGFDLPLPGSGINYLIIGRVSSCLASIVCYSLNY